MPIAKRLQAAREKLALSQEEAAEKWGISVRTLQNWECRRNTPRGFARKQLESLLNSILGSAETERQAPRT